MPQEFTMIESAPSTEKETKWRKDRPKERAVVAMDSTEELVVVLEFIGPELDWLQTFEPIANAFLAWCKPPGPGIWMWEGGLRWHTSYEGEHDFEMDGEFRPLTETEAKQSMSGDSPWDPDLWIEREPMTASLPPDPPSKES